ncbi:MAG: sugar phosphate isomerase/epimerase [Clostridia bacterium]|nr:sugar phosphate isomerase/epimerase [Clostridia bacterium]
MKTSMNISCTVRVFGLEKAIELHKKAGFDAYDFSAHTFVEYDWRTKTAYAKANEPIIGDDYITSAKMIKKYADDLGIICSTAHAPFPSDSPYVSKYLNWAIEVSSILGAKQIVVHPGCSSTAEENALFYKKLLPFAKEKGIKIACENMWNWNYDPKTMDPSFDHAIEAACSHHDDFKKHLTLVNDDYLIACLDIGHAEMKGLNTTAVEMIKTLNDKIECLHIHDNDKWHDDHAAPFTGKIDFTAMCKALKEINYTGDITLEVDPHFAKDEPYDSALKTLTSLANTAKKLRDMILNG